MMKLWRSKLRSMVPMTSLMLIQLLVDKEDHYSVTAPLTDLAEISEDDLVQILLNLETIRVRRLVKITLAILVLPRTKQISHNRTPLVNQQRPRKLTRREGNVAPLHTMIVPPHPPVLNLRTMTLMIVNQGTIHLMLPTQIINMNGTSSK